MNSVGDKYKSLKWAIDELSKQKEELDSKLKIALKREETESLIEEVNAQKEALNKRITALQDGLEVSTELVDVPIDSLQNEISTVNDKLEIAKERIQILEQEQYLEELGRKLNRTPEDQNSENFKDNDEFSSFTPSLEQTSTSEIPETILPEQETSTTTKIMASTSNRIETEKSSTTRLPDEMPIDKDEISNSENNNSIPLEGLEETALKLGVEPDFLVEKGTKALLRMIARNGGQLKFPLEIDQID